MGQLKDIGSNQWQWHYNEIEWMAGINMERKYKREYICTCKLPTRIKHRNENEKKYGNGNRYGDRNRERGRK